MGEQGERIKVLSAGIAGLLLSLGVARFAYTPLLPLMQDQAGLGVSAAGWLAAVHYAGYLTGAAVATVISDLVLKDRLYRIGMVLALVTTPMMAWTTNEVLQTLNERKLTIQEFPIPAATLAGLIQHVKKIGLNKQRAREVYAYMLEHGVDPQQATDALGIKPGADAAVAQDRHRRMLQEPRTLARLAVLPAAALDHHGVDARASEQVR